jgi:hypothetical protein
MMNKPEFKGKYCGDTCRYIDGIRECVLYRDHSGNNAELEFKHHHPCDDFTLVRHPGCLAEHGLDHIVDANKMVWSKEPPTENGMYWTRGENIDYHGPLLLENGEWYRVGYDMIYWDIEWYGPRIEFPELPEGE